MGQKFTNIHNTDFEEGTTPRGGRWRHLDLSGEHLGVRIEEIPPGSTSSFHHYHTLEEEHVLALSGVATLHLGSDEHELGEGDHVWFRAGDETAHHLENRGPKDFRFLVFGERMTGDVVVYPNGPVMMVKALGWKQFTYEERAVPDARRDE
jgi:uncharacterized cupin superfamily protein